MRGAVSLVRKDDHTIRDTYIAVLLTLCEILVYLLPSLRRDSSEPAPSAAVSSAPSAGPLPSGDDSGVLSFWVDCSALSEYGGGGEKWSTSVDSVRVHSTPQRSRQRGAGSEAGGRLLGDLDDPFTLWKRNVDSDKRTFLHSDRLRIKPQGSTDVGPPSRSSACQLSPKSTKQPTAAAAAAPTLAIFTAAVITRTGTICRRTVG